MQQIVDSHQHFWQLGRFAYSWMPENNKILYRDYLPDCFAMILQENGVAKSVAVQADQSIEETQWLLELSDQFNFIAGVVGWVDLQSNRVEKQLDEFSKHPKFKGIRHIVQDEPSDDWILQPKVLQGINKLVGYDLTYDILVFPCHLKHIPTVFEKCPEVNFVIDHLAKPSIATGEIKDWAKDMKIIASHSKVFCKVSGLVTEANHQNWKADDLRPYIETVLELFGAERLMFGSDYPVCLLASSYHKVLETYQSFFKDLTKAEQNLIFKENAINFYKL